MEAKECIRFDSCSAPLCPLDENSLNNGIWYFDEEICHLREFCHLPWIRNQKKIAKKARDYDSYFTLRMLEQNCMIKAGITGIDSETPLDAVEREEKKWLNNQPVKKELSQQEREAQLKHLKKMRESINQGNTPEKKKVETRVF